ncbi:MAG: riboflavin synthase [Chitinophagales bacterium]|nr:riboflavin synthase [Chitinophagales bacterium]MCZ2392920.1 riboflavin synthase [Chitinophagales bacterium]
MFTGIIESIGRVVDKQYQGENIHFTIESSVASELKIDQSVAHNGVCLTVVKIEGNTYVVTAIKETLDKTNLDNLEIGDAVNLERAMLASARLDGHIVQGHVDTTAKLDKIIDKEGSSEFYFKISKNAEFSLVDKGSVCIDGVSLTVVKANKRKFHVAIIPYTLEHTVFHLYQEGQIVNIEFDIIGKYVQRYFKAAIE